MAWERLSRKTGEAEAMRRPGPCGVRKAQRRMCYKKGCLSYSTGPEMLREVRENWPRYEQGTTMTEERHLSGVPETSAACRELEGGQGGGKAQTVS